MHDLDQQRGRAREFARALLDLAQTAGRVDAVGADLDSLAELVASNADFARLVDSPLINESAKAASMQRIFRAGLPSKGPAGSPDQAGSVDELTLRFLRSLAEHDALPLLRVLGEVLRQERDNRLGRVKVEATTARPLDEAERQGLAGRLSAVLAAPIILQERVDGSLLGGLVLRVGDTLFDGSVRQRLEQLRRQVIARGYHEIQGRRDLLAD